MDLKAFSTAVSTFSAKFCNELIKDRSVVSSPLSAEFVLALLTLGSTNEVHTELLTSLGIADDDSIRSSFSAVSSKFKSIKGITLNVANKVYIKDGPYELNENLKQDAIQVFDCEFQKLHFNNPIAAADVINKWVESKTNNRIKDLLSADSIDSLTRLVLVNALYFKGTWAQQFDSSYTKPRAFHIDEEKTIDVPMMYKEDRYQYGVSEELNAQLLQLDYIGEEASMVIVLPNEINGLDGILQKLAAGHDLMHDINLMTKTKVNVLIPKFKIETTIDLTKLLPKLGIKAIFNPINTGLSKVLNTGGALYVSTAVQKAFIEVNEEGAEAAAATCMVKTVKRISRRPPRFHADRPFLYVLTIADVPAFIGLYRGDTDTSATG